MSVKLFGRYDCYCRGESVRGLYMENFHFDEDTYCILCGKKLTMVYPQKVSVDVDIDYGDGKIKKNKVNLVEILSEQTR